MNSRTITLQGRNFTQPDTSTAWQRERAEGPLQDLAVEFAGRRRLASWAAFCLVGVVFWTVAIVSLCS
jgi:hypothetical protein